MSQRSLLLFCLFLSGPILLAQGTVTFSHSTAGDMTNRVAEGGERGSGKQKLSDSLHTFTPSLDKSFNRHAVSKQDTIFARQASRRESITPEDRDAFIENYITAYERFSFKQNGEIYLIPTLCTLSSVKIDELCGENLTFEERRARYLEKIIRSTVVLSTCEYAIDLSSGKGYWNGCAWQGKYSWIEHTTKIDYYRSLAEYLKSHHFNYLFYIPELSLGKIPVFWIIYDGEIFALDYLQGRYVAIDIESYIMRKAKDQVFYNLKDHYNEMVRMLDSLGTQTNKE